MSVPRLFSGSKFFRYQFQDFFRYQFFPIPVSKLFSVQFFSNTTKTLRHTLSPPSWPKLSLCECECCQNCNQCLKCHKSQYCHCQCLCCCCCLFVVKIVKIVNNNHNCHKCHDCQKSQVSSVALCLSKVKVPGSWVICAVPSR